MNKGLYTRAALAGLSDGITLPLAAAAALTGAGVKYETLLPVIFIVTIAGAVLLSLANYFTIKEEQEPQSHGHAFKEMEALPQKDKEEAISQIMAEQQQWKGEMVAVSQDLSPAKSAVTVFTFFGLGGSVILWSYYFNNKGLSALSLSAAIALPLLFIIGGMCGKLNGKSFIAGSVRTVLISAAAAGAAYGAAHIFTL